MMYEYEQSWEYVKLDGPLLWDAVSSNIAFKQFSEIRTRTSGKALLGFGFAIRQS